MNPISKKQALKRLKQLVAGIEDDSYIFSRHPEIRNKWKRNAKITVEDVFGQDSGHVAEIETCFREGDQWSKNECVALLESMIHEVTTRWSGRGHAAAPAVEDVPAEPAAAALVRPDSNKVFLVHGHDREVKETVARFLENKNLKVVILDEEPGQGRTIIEKFEDHSSAVSYAIVLMTPDDVAQCREGSALAHRARQNVVFELGFFVGVLKRRRVCVISKGDLEIPSDYWGVEYIPWDDAGGWQGKLLRELKAAELDIQES